MPVATFVLVLLATQAAQPAFFRTPLTLAEMTGRQAVVETSVESFVLALLPDAAPNHVGHFIKLATEGAYDGTTFHRMVTFGIIQGGDPISTAPAGRPSESRSGRSPSGRRRRRKPSPLPRHRSPSSPLIARCS